MKNDLNPENSLDSIRQYFEELAPRWDSLQPPGRAEVIDSLLGRYDNQFNTEGLILDVGTGTGALIPVFTRRYPNATVISIDLAHQMLWYARKKEKDANLIQADALTLPFTHQVFSGIICHNSFPHFRNKLQALSELRRILRKDGNLLILHDISRQQVNAIHQNAQSPVIRKDLLPAVDTFDHWLPQSGFFPTCLVDNDVHYVVVAKAV
jgi:ubiquinone/menaquinone biosynthesis C-methylase UbiE